MSGKPVALRPHHGMCLAYFQGKGYSQGFAAHMGRLKAELAAETPLRLVVTDVVCAACPNNVDGVCRQAALVEGYDRQVLARCGLAEGQELSYGEFRALVDARILEPGLRREICGGCQWDSLCHFFS